MERRRFSSYHQKKGTKARRPYGFSRVALGSSAKKRKRVRTIRKKISFIKAACESRPERAARAAPSGGRLQSPIIITASGSDIFIDSAILPMLVTDRDSIVQSRTNRASNSLRCCTFFARRVLQELRPLRASQCDHYRCVIRLRAIGFRCDLLDPGDVHAIRGSDAGLQRSTAQRPCASRPVAQSRCGLLPSEPR